MRPQTRVALFTDAFYEANGVARIARDFETYAARHDLPFMCVCAGPTTRIVQQGSHVRLELRRSFAAVRVEHDLAFDPLLWRHLRRVDLALEAFRPSVIHVTGPSDIGQLGAWLGHHRSIPLVGSWHTNLHQYAALRTGKWLQPLPGRLRRPLQRNIERGVLSATLLFYRIPRILLAPNRELVSLLSHRTGKPTELMHHGVDLDLFNPVKRERHSPVPLQIGFVGRLSPEKQVRELATLENALVAAGVRAFEVVIVGDGGEKEWLAARMTRARFCGIQRGETLARTVADLDIFVFPSNTETFGLALLEAMASGVPVIAMASGGPTTFVEHEASGVLAGNVDEWVAATVRLCRDEGLRLRLGVAARRAAEAWASDRVFDSLCDIYRATVQSSAPDRRS